MWQLPFTIPDGGRFNGSILGGGRVVSDLVIREHGTVQSEDWVLGSSGWIIHGDGSVEFNNGVFRGAITASTIDIGGSDATSFHVDTSGNMWLGAAAFASAPFKVASSGAVTLATSLEMASGGTISTGPTSNRRIRMYGFGGSGAFIEGINASNVIDGMIKWSDSVLRVRGNASMDLEVTSTAGGSIVALFEINSTSPYFSMSNGSGQLDVNLILRETSHGTSKRSAIIHENVGQIGVDINGNGTRDWYVYDSVGGYTPLLLTFASGRMDVGGGFGPALGPWVGGGSYACFAHNGVFATSTSYAMLQDNLGNTYINSPSSRETFHRINNVSIARTTGAGFYVAMPGSSSTTNVVDGGSGLLCVFTSRRELKQDIRSVPGDDAVQLLRMIDPVTYRWRNGVGIDGDRNEMVDWATRFGFIAEDLADVDSDLASWGVVDRPFHDPEEGQTTPGRRMDGSKRPEPTVDDLVPTSINQVALLSVLMAAAKRMEQRIVDLEDALSRVNAKLVREGFWP